MRSAASVHHLNPNRREPLRHHHIHPEVSVAVPVTVNLHVLTDHPMPDALLQHHCRATLPRLASLAHRSSSSTVSPRMSSMRSAFECPLPPGSDARSTSARFSSSVMAQPTQ